MTQSTATSHPQADQLPCWTPHLLPTAARDLWRSPRLSSVPSSSPLLPSLPSSPAMGKSKDKKKLHSAQTAEKQKKKATKNLLKQTGEASIDQILADLTAHDTAATAVTISPLTLPDPTTPSPRSNCTLTPHPSKPFLILFGGEFFNGQTTSVYNDLFLLHLPSHQWRRVTSPNTPAPRSAHQSVVVTRGDDVSLYLFGGEFQSPSASQFHHWSHLYSLSLDSYHWTLVGGGASKGAGGGGSATTWPAGRSGHRMVAYSSRYLLLFGGFIDDGSTVRFLNDLWTFDLSTRVWTNVGRERKADVDNPNRWPPPRGGACLWVDEDKLTAYLFGGMTVHRAKGGGKGGKAKAGGVDVEEHLTDLWSLNLTTMQWTAVKKRGTFPNERTGIACAYVGLGSRKRALLFGGVSDEADGKEGAAAAKAKQEAKQGNKGGGKGSKAKKGGKRGTRDEEEDEEDEDDEEEDEEEEEEEDRSIHYNDLFTMVPDTGLFHLNHTRGHLVTAFKQSISKKQQPDDKKEQPKPADSKETDELTPSSSSAPSIFDFNPVIDALPNPGVSSSSSASSFPSTANPSSFPCPAPRRSASLCVKDGVVWLYGGVCENDRGREHTFSDLWCIDVGGQEWKEVDKDREDTEWLGSEDEKEDDDGEEPPVPQEDDQEKVAAEEGEEGGEEGGEEDAEEKGEDGG